MMKSKLYIGPAGWSYPDWEGIVYPRPKPRVFDPLVYIASYFNLIEINSTFYRVPSADTCRSWVRRVADREGFAFSVKANSEFTHGRTNTGARHMHVFKSAIDPLFDAGVLSTVLLQFPWSFRFSREARDYVCSLTERLSPFPSAVEVRHASWSADGSRQFFRERNVTLCGVDQPLVGASLEPSVFQPGAAGYYFRLHGRNRDRWFDRKAGRDARYDYLYSGDELSVIHRRIDRLASGQERVHVVLNNHFRGQAVANALQLKAMLSGTPVEAPPQLLARFPHLAGLARPVSHGPAAARPSASQGNLFQQDNEQQENRAADENR
ncbi:MAG: DUF72 domain-containing protein [Candidatus Krumholzibacteriia bacterium]